MSNTRIMTLEDYDEKLQEEATKLRRAIPQMRAEIRRDPEGCFGGRGNNIGYAMLEDAENRSGYLASLGYVAQTAAYIEMLQAGIDLSTIEKVIGEGRGGKLGIGGTPGYKRTKILRSGVTAQVNWVYDREVGAWEGGEPPTEVLEAAEAVARHYGATSLLDWRGNFHCPRVYI